MNDMRRLGIYATYCKSGIVDDYIIYYLSEIRKCLTTLVVVSNIKLTDESKKQVSEYADYIFERGDDGFDVGGLRSVMVEYFGWIKVRTYDELVLMNDSTFGPFYPFKEVFLKMSQYNDLDFWGLTERGKSDFDGGEVQFPEHIQLYFYVIRRKLLCSNDFEIFWNEIIKKITNFRSAIFNYEFAFTQYFAKIGYKWDTYCHLRGYETNNFRNNLSPYHYASYELIKKCRCPVLKRKLFTGEFVEMKYSGREDLMRIFQYIKEETNYDVNLMWKYILRNFPIHEIMESLKLCYTLRPSEGISSKSYQKKITLVKCFEKESAFDNLFISKQSISNNMSGWNNLILVVLALDNDNLPHSIIESDEYRDYENLAKNEAYLGEIIKLFRDNPRLGMLVPPIPMYGKVSNYILHTWENYFFAKSIYDKLNLHVPIIADRSPIPVVTAFICRKDVLDDKLLSLISSKNIKEMVQMIPLYAQEKNYYTAYIQSYDYAGISYFNSNRMIYDVFKQLDDNSLYDINSVLDYIKVSKIKEFCGKNEHIFIYGAGQLAERAAKIIGLAGRKFEGFIVTSMTDNVEILLEHRVCSINSIVNRNEEIGVIIAAGKNHNNLISQNLESIGIHNQLIF